MGKAKEPDPEPELRKGLVWELIFFLLLQGMDVGAGFAILFNAVQAENTYKKYIFYNETNGIGVVKPTTGSMAAATVTTLGINATRAILQTTATTTTTTKRAFDPADYLRKARSIGLCTNTNWDREKLLERFDLFGLVINIYMAFLGLACLIFFLHFCMWIVAIVLSLTKIDFIMQQYDKVVTGKIIFSVAASFLHDIPISCIAIELYLLQRGSNGFVCYQCSHSALCKKADHVDDLLSDSASKLSFLLFAIALTSTWKGLTSMFRFSRTGVVDIFIIRAIVSLFAAGIYNIVILTPAMMILKYRYYTLPGVQKGFFADIIDRIMIIGALMWVIVLMGGCCCPLMSMIKLD